MLLRILLCCLFFPSLTVLAAQPDNIETQVIDTQTHNSDWFTQGLFLGESGMIISSGLYGKSVLIVEGNSETWRQPLPASYFAEGLTAIGDQIYLLTWKENTLLVFDKQQQALIKQLPYEGEGWGLTHTPQFFIMSNGTNQLQFRRLDTFTLDHTLTVPGLNRLNELEYVKGVIWANRWYDDRIYAINSHNGCVLGAINLQHLRQQATDNNRAAVTNGIAYDKKRKGLWVTGKYWRKRFLIALPDIQTSEGCHNP